MGWGRSPREGHMSKACQVREASWRRSCWTESLKEHEAAWEGRVQQQGMHLRRKELCRGPAVGTGPGCLKDHMDTGKLRQPVLESGLFLRAHGIAGTGSDVYLRRIRRGSGVEETAAECAHLRSREGRPESWRSLCQGAQGCPQTIRSHSGQPSQLPSPHWLLSGSEAETEVVLGPTAPTSCGRPRDPWGGRKEDLCQMSAFSPPSQLAGTSCEATLSNRSWGFPQDALPLAHPWRVSVRTRGGR